MTAKLRRRSINGELRARVEEQVLAWVGRNPGRQIPGSVIGDKYGIGRTQVTTVTKGLIRQGRLERVSRYTYQIAEGGGEPQQIQAPLPPPTKVGQALSRHASAREITELAKEFHWQHNSDSLREFVEWLGKGVK